MLEQDALESARLELLQRLDSGRTKAERNRSGQFATPPELAEEVVACALSLLPKHARIRFLDPAFGTGPFYSALLHLVTESRVKTAVGYEIDRYYGEPVMQLFSKTPLALRIGDFTTSEPPADAERFNMVVCNPPYVRHHHLSATQKSELRTALSRRLNMELNGLSGLYAYFLLLSQAWMAKGGVGAWLIPSEFMDVNYGRKVKNFLTDKVTLRRIHRFHPHDVQFSNALVSSAVVFFSNDAPAVDTEVEFTFGGSLLKPRLTSTIALSDLRRVAKWTGIPSDAASPAPRRGGSTLADLFTIKRGLVTGSNSFFILSADQARDLHLPAKFLRPILPGPRELDSDEIMADSHGEPQIDERRYLLACDLPETEVRRKYPALWTYLERGVKDKIHEGYICRHRQPWYSQEKRNAALFLCTYMGRPTKQNRSPFRFILNHSIAIAANVYLMLYPKPTLAAALREDQLLLQSVWHALSRITADVLTGEGRVYGGGLHKLEPAELANVPGDAILDVLKCAGDFEDPKQLELFGA